MYSESAPIVKIAGTPTDAQSTQVEAELIPDGYDYLCQTVGLCPARGRPWPFVNHAEPLPIMGADGYASLETGHAGAVECYFVNEAGHIHVHSSCS